MCVQAVFAGWVVGDEDPACTWGQGVAGGQGARVQERPGASISQKPLSFLRALMVGGSAWMQVVTACPG